MSWCSSAAASWALESTRSCATDTPPAQGGKHFKPKVFAKAFIGSGVEGSVLAEPVLVVQACSALAQDALGD